MPPSLTATAFEEAERIDNSYLTAFPILIMQLIVSLKLALHYILPKYTNKLY